MAVSLKCIALLLLGSCSQAAPTCYSKGGFCKTKWPHCFQVHSNANMLMYGGKTEDGNFMKIGMYVEGHTGGWSALAIAGNGGMKGAREIVVRQEASKWVAEDRYSMDYVMPTLSEQQDVQLLFASEEDGATSWGVLLPIDACKPKLNSLPTNYPLGDDISRFVLWALGSSHTFGYHKARGATQANLISGPTSTPSLAGATEVDIIMPNVDVVLGKGGSDASNPYVCATSDMKVLMPDANLTNKHHVIKFAPRIDPVSAKYVHHIILYGCRTDQGFPKSMQKHGAIIEECESMPPGCSAFKWPWAVGVEDIYMPPDVGFPFGEGERWLILQMHYYNPNGDTGIKDSSGVKLFFTPTLRTHDAGSFQFNGGTGPGMRDSLPIAKQTVLDFTVPNRCTLRWSDPLNVIGVVHHQHVTGVHQQITVLRNGKYLGPLRIENGYDFNHQSLAQTGVSILKPGDELHMSCAYDTSKRSNPTVFGDLTQNEMCFSIAMYWPRQMYADSTNYQTKGHVRDMVSDEEHGYNRPSWYTEKCTKAGSAGTFGTMSKCAEVYFTDPVFETAESQTGVSATLLCNNILKQYEVLNGQANINRNLGDNLCPACAKDMSCTDDIMKEHIQTVVCPLVCSTMGLSVYPDQSATTPVNPTEATSCGGVGQKSVVFFKPTPYTAPQCVKQGDLSSAVAAAIAQESCSGPAPTAAPEITSTGSFEVKMTKVDATALATSASAKTALASALGKTLGLPGSSVKITGIYVDGVKIGARRLQTDSTVKVEWEVKAPTAVLAAEISASTLKTNIETEAKAVGVTLTIKDAPAVIVNKPDAPVVAPGASAVASDAKALTVLGHLLAAFVVFS